MAKGTYCFHGDRRLRKRAEIQRVFKEGKRAAGRAVTVFCLLRGDDGPWRLGLTATRKTIGKAVARNRARRRAREFFRKRGPALPPGWDFVALMKPPALSLPAEAFARDLRQSLERLGFNVPLASPGTVRPAPPDEEGS